MFAIKSKSAIRTGNCPNVSMVVALLAVLAGTSIPERASGMSIHDDCPDLTGEWASGQYEALSVSSQGTHSELPGLSMVLNVTRQQGCHFVATNVWGNASIGGSEHVAGILNPLGNWITILEVGEHPEGGTTGRVRGRLVDQHRINWEYAAYANDGSRAIVFSTVLARAGMPAEREVCPDVLGTWKSPQYDVFEVHADGSTTRQAGTRNTLEIVHQQNCHFRGLNTWSNGDRGGSEHVAGVLHADGALITMLEVGDLPKEGTQAYVRARLTGPESMEWNYAGLTSDASKGQVFAVNLSREGDPGPRESCPDLTGTWSSAHWEGLLLDAGGEHEVLSHEYKRLTVEEQFGCAFMATLEYGLVARAGPYTERVIGVMSAEEGVMTMRVVAPHPENGRTATLTVRLADDGRIITEYTGSTADSSEIFVYLLDLVRE